MATLFAATMPVAVIMLRRTSSDTIGTIRVLVPARAVVLRDAVRLPFLLLLGLSGRAEASLKTGRPALRMFTVSRLLHAGARKRRTYPNIE